MNYQQFKTNTYALKLGAEVKQSCSYYGTMISETVDGYVFINDQLTEFVSLEEAKDHLRQQNLYEDIQKEIQYESYEEMSHNKIVDIIKAHHGDVKVTDTLVESYIELASSKIFTTDPVAHDMSSFNKISRIVEGRLDYNLDDGTSVVITEDTYQRINNIFGNHPDVIKHMRSSVDNFLDVVNALEE
jgi:hypothetical protein